MFAYNALETDYFTNKNEEVFTLDNLNANLSNGIAKVFEYKKDDTSFIIYSPNNEKTIYGLTVSDGKIECSAFNTFSNAISSVNYGDSVVYSVVVNDLQCDNWKVFYNDGENVFLIYGDYLRSKATPTVSNLTYNAGDQSKNRYRVFWFKNSVDTLEDLDYNVIKRFQAGKDGYNLKNYNNSYAISTLLNYNNWNEFCNSNLIDYGIGSPTLEMFLASITEKYPEYTNITYSYMNEYGYSLKKGDLDFQGSLGASDMQGYPGYQDALALYTSDDSLTKNVYGNVYYPHPYIDGSYWYQTNGYWLATPSYTSENNILRVGSNGGIVEKNISNMSNSIRPVICVKSKILAVNLNNKWYLYNE